MNDPYRVLGVTQSATDDEIKAAYRKLAKQYHPDVNNGSQAAEARMKELNEAYTFIMQQRRAQGAGSAGNGYSYHSGYSDATARFQAVRRYLEARHFQEAWHLLSEIPERTADWYYLSACANLMAGYRVEALNHANTAVRMAPTNPEYRQLLAHLQGSRDFYQSHAEQSGFGDAGSICSNPLSSCCAINLLCNCLCGGCGYTRC